MSVQPGYLNIKKVPKKKIIKTLNTMSIIKIFFFMQIRKIQEILHIHAYQK